MRKFVACVCIAAGVLVLAYPKASAWFNERQQAQLLAGWQLDQFNDRVQQDAIVPYDALNQLLANHEDTEQETESTEDRQVETSQVTPESAFVASQIDPQPSAAVQPSKTPIPTIAPEKSKAKPNGQAMATINIASIDLTLPVLEGATEWNMRFSAVHMTETAAIGEIGNVAIAAHRMKQKGKLFNRLHEVEVDDRIVMETREGTFTYIVYDILIVEPTDVSVLNYNDVDRRLTLITCDPVVDPTHRLIVHARME